jgi:hypothetical protein
MMKKFRIIDPTTDATLAGLDSVGRDNSAFTYGRPSSRESQLFDDLEVNETTSYVFQTGRGKTAGRVTRIE